MTDKPWVLFSNQHVIPKEDGERPHELHSACWCEPLTERRGEVLFVTIHKAADGRRPADAIAQAGRLPEA